MIQMMIHKNKSLKTIQL